MEHEKNRRSDSAALRNSLGGIPQDVPASRESEDSGAALPVCVQKSRLATRVVLVLKSFSENKVPNGRESAFYRPRSQAEQRRGCSPSFRIQLRMGKCSYRNADMTMESRYLQKKPGVFIDFPKLAEGKSAWTSIFRSAPALPGVSPDCVQEHLRGSS